MNNKRILTFLLALVLSLTMSTGVLAGSIADKLQNNPWETPSVSEHGVTIDIKNVLADSSCVYIVYQLTVSDDMILPENAQMGVTNLVVDGPSVSSCTSTVLARTAHSQTVLLQYVPFSPIKGTKATLELAYLSYVDLDTNSDKFLIEENWKLEFDLKLEDSIELEPNVKIADVMGTLQSMSISPLSARAVIEMPGEAALPQDLKTVITLKDGSKAVYKDDKTSLTGDTNSDDDGNVISTTAYILYFFEDAIAIKDIASITVGGIEIGLSSNSGTPSSTRSELPSDWAREQVDAAVGAGIVPETLLSGYTKAATRGEFCALAVKLYESVNNTEITERAQFDDTDDINVQKMAGLGIAQGVGDGIFAPDRNLTREQAATLLARLAEACNKTLVSQTPDFSDSSEISPWAADAVGQAQKAAVMSGVGENRFAPQGDYTREQSIMTMMRLFNLVK